MAIIYVDSAASGTNAGTSWANAYTSLGSTTGANAGDTVLMDDGHDEARSANTTWTWTNGTSTNPVKILSVDKATDALSAGATIRSSNNTNITLQGSIYAHGLTIGIFGELILGSSSVAAMTFESCNIGIAAGANGNRRIQVTSSANGGSVYRFLNCNTNLDTGGASNGFIQLTTNGYVEFVGGTLRANSAASQVISINSRPVRVHLHGVDLSDSTETTLVNWNNAPGATADVVRCRLPSGYSPSTGTMLVGNTLTLERCASGSITAAPLGLTYMATETGTVQSTLSRYRTGGADDGVQANAHAWEMAAGSAALEVFGPLAAPSLLRWVEGGSSVTFTMYVASGTTLNDDDFWIELGGPDDSSPTFSQGYTATSRMSPQGTPAALTTDATSTWNGSGVGTKQKVSLTYTPAIDGPVEVRCFLAKPSTTVYVDPLVEVS